MSYLWGVCRHLSACVLMSIFLPVGRLKVAFRCLPQCFSTLFFETELSFHLELTDWLGWLANKLQGLLLVLEILAWVILSKHLMAWAVFLDRIIFWTFSRICIYIFGGEEPVSPSWGPKFNSQHHVVAHSCLHLQSQRIWRSLHISIHFKHTYGP